MRSTLTLSLFFIFLPPISADDWPQWLGPKRDSVWRESGIIKTFPKDGPKLRWEVAIQGGYTGPAVADGKVYVMDWIPKPSQEEPKNLNEGEIPKNHNFVRELQSGTERVICLNEKDGSELWTHEYAANYTTVTMYAIGPRCTPAVDGDRVYTLGSEGDLKCLRTSDGKEIWAKNFVTDYQAKVAFWGFSSHPLIEKDKLITIVGGKESLVIAFDKKTGKEIWKANSSIRPPGEPGYCAPVIYEIAGERQLLIWHAKGLLALNPKTGKQLWEVGFLPTFNMTIGMPRWEKNKIFMMAFSRKSWAVEVHPEGRSAKIAWRGNTKIGIGGVMNSPIIQDGYIYGCGVSGRYTCAKLENGERMWTTYAPTSNSRHIHWGNAFTVKHEDRFFIANDLGELVLAKLSPEKYEEISRVKLIEPTHAIGSRKVVWSHPAFAQKSVYLRNDKVLKCYSLAEQ